MQLVKDSAKPVPKSKQKYFESLYYRNEQVSGETES